MQPVRGMAHKQQQQSAGRVLITASSISGRPSNAVGKWQRREEASTFVLSRYRFFWWGARWEEFLKPVPGGIAFARQTPACKAGIAALLPRPGVYEFALTKGPKSQRFKVYIGETNNMARRHGWEYRAHGDHLAPFFEAALNDGATIWRRVRYTESKQEAVEWEHRFLSQFDYAWNRRSNAQARHVALRQVCCCCCARTMVARYAASDQDLHVVPRRAPSPVVRPLPREQFLLATTAPPRY